MTFIDKAGAANSSLPSRKTVPRATGSPRLLYTPQTLRALAVEAASDPALATQWRDFLAATEKLLTVPLLSEAAALSGVGQHGSMLEASRLCSDAGLCLGLAYHVTGNRGYAERLREILLHYAGYSRWVGPDFGTRQPAWHSELATAAFSFGYATGYDAIAPFLTGEERMVVRRALVERGIRPLLADWVLPTSRIHALDSMGHNWWSVCISTAGFGALALLEEEPEAPEWLEAVRNALGEWFHYAGNRLDNKPATFDPHGGLYEGVHYTEYGVAEYLRFRIACHNVLGEAPFEDRSVLEGAGRFALDALYPAAGEALSLNFGDSSLRAGHAVEMMRLLCASGFRDGLKEWYVASVERNRQLRRATSAEALRLLFRLPLAGAGAPELPTSALYAGIGWAMMRSSWQPSATMVAMKCGYTWNHAHADAGSFVFFHRGEPLLIDSGACGYDRPEYVSYYVQSRAHNVVLFEGEGQAMDEHDRGVKCPGTLEGLLDNGKFRYVRADATGPMAQVFSRNYRHWLWVGRVLLVIDDVRAHRPGRFDWLLHYAGTAQAGAQGVRIVNGGAAAQVKFLHPEALSASVEKGLAPEHPEMECEYLRFSTVDPARDAKFITAIVPEEEGAQPDFELRRGGEWIGVRVTQADEVTDIWLNLTADGRRAHLNSFNTFGSWTTDAYLLAITRPKTAADRLEQLTSVLIVNGSTLRYKGHPVWDSLGKADVLFSPSRPEQILARGQVGAHVRYSPGTRPDSLIVNGQPTAWVERPAGVFEFQLTAES